MDTAGAERPCLRRHDLAVPRKDLGILNYRCAQILRRCLWLLGLKRVKFPQVRGGGATNAKDKIKKLVSEIAERDETQKIDVKAELTAWKSSIEALHKDVRSWLSPAGDKVTFKATQTDLHEDQLGTYQAPELLVAIGSESLTFKPVGRLVIGARGRVDVVSSSGKVAMLLLLGEHEGPQVVVRTFFSDEQRRKAADEDAKSEPRDPGKIIWKIGRRATGVEVFPLTEDSFSDLLSELL